MGPTQLPIQWLPGIKGPGCEGDHLGPGLWSRVIPDDLTIVQMYQKILLILRKPKVHYRVYKSQQSGPFQRQTKPNHILKTYLLHILI